MALRLRHPLQFVFPAISLALRHPLFPPSLPPRRYLASWHSMTCWHFGTKKTKRVTNDKTSFMTCFDFGFSCGLLSCLIGTSAERAPREHSCMRACVRACIHACTRSCMCVSTYMHMFVHSSLILHACMHVCDCVCVFMCMYVHTHTHTHTHRHADQCMHVYMYTGGVLATLVSNTLFLGMLASILQK